MKIFLAGVEGAEPQRIRNEIEYAFYSYYYLRGNKRPQVMEGTKEAHKILFIDSGAHSFFNEKSKIYPATRNLLDYEVYFEDDPYNSKIFKISKKLVEHIFFQDK